MGRLLGMEDFRNSWQRLSRRAKGKFVRAQDLDPIGVFSPGVAGISTLEAFLGHPIVRLRNAQPASVPNLSAIAGWGYKRNTLHARKFALAHGLRYLALEDGFLRSVGLGVDGAPPLSLVVDDVGVYYDASSPSRLELLISEDNVGEEELARSRQAMQLILAYGLSKYNHAPPLELPHTKRQRVLVVDQTVNDMSVLLGGASEETFQAMLAAARQDNPEAEILIKVHPDVLAGKKEGYIGCIHDKGAILIGEDCCAHSLLKQVDRVYVATSQIGFEALMLQKPVTVYGLPWYAGWGLTDDRHPDIGAVKARRWRRASVELLFHCAYLKYSRYINPATGKPGTVFDVIDWIARNKEIDRQLPRKIKCIGMSMWKRAIVAPFLRTPTTQVTFARSLSPSQLRTPVKDTCLVFWGNAHVRLRETAAAMGWRVARMEDGFIRSAGLGSDLYGPLSLAVDDAGIYYDPHSGSRLEQLLMQAVVEPMDRERASRLRDRLVKYRISKYNVGRGFVLNRASAGRKVILVPGQVEGDASVLVGSPALRSNDELLAEVRRKNRDAWIVYKPHPDVEARNRSGNLSPLHGQGLADQIAHNVNISDCLAAVDEVHTMTSLAGFEGLLFRKTVHCYGAPFYAGWGLTVDHLDLSHRTRRLSLEELIFVSLFRYPRYRLPHVSGFCSVEDVVEYLISSQSRPNPTGSNWLEKKLRKINQLGSALLRMRDV